MKKLSAIFMIICLICASTVFASAADAPEDISDKVKTYVSPLYEIDDCKLIVNGKEISDYSEYVKIYYNDDGFVDAQFPLFSVVKAMGGKVFWIGKYAVIVYKTGVYFFNSDCEYLSYFPYFEPLISEDFQIYFSFFNLLKNPFPGGRAVYETISLDKEVIVNDTEVLLLRSSLSFRIKCDIAEKTINIESVSKIKRAVNVIKDVI